jgi:hypothetical protein
MLVALACLIIKPGPFHFASKILKRTFGKSIIPVKNPFVFASSFSKPTASLMDAWRFGEMFTELWTGDVTIIVLRNLSWAVNWHHPKQRVTAEDRRMVTEKIAAAMEIHAAWLRLVFGSLSGEFNPLRSGRKSMAPLHRQATANAWRLARRRPV